jgi:hypothetical protein
LILSAGCGAEPKKSCSVRVRTSRSRPRTRARASTIVVLQLLFGPISTVWSRNWTFPILIPRKFSMCRSETRIVPAQAARIVAWGGSDVNVSSRSFAPVGQPPLKVSRRPTSEARNRTWVTPAGIHKDPGAPEPRVLQRSGPAAVVDGQSPHFTAPRTRRKHKKKRAL